MDIFLVSYEFIGNDYYTDLIPIAAYKTYDRAFKCMNEYANDVKQGTFYDLEDIRGYDVTSRDNYTVTLYSEERNNTMRFIMQKLQLKD